MACLEEMPGGSLFSLKRAAARLRFAELHMSKPQNNVLWADDTKERCLTVMHNTVFEKTKHNISA